MKKRNAKKYAVQFKTDKRVQQLEQELHEAKWQATSVTLDNVGLEVKVEELQGLLDEATEAYEETQVAVDLLQVQLNDVKGQLDTSIRACDAFSEDADRYYRMYEAAQDIADKQAIAFYEWKDKLKSRTTWLIPLTFAAGGLLGLTSMYFQLGV